MVADDPNGAGISLYEYSSKTFILGSVSLGSGGELS